MIYCFFDFLFYSLSIFRSLHRPPMDMEREDLYIDIYIPIHACTHVHINFLLPSKNLNFSLVFPSSSVDLLCKSMTQKRPYTISGSWFDVSSSCLFIYIFVSLQQLPKSKDQTRRSCFFSLC